MLVKIASKNEHEYNQVLHPVLVTTKVIVRAKFEVYNNILCLKYEILHLDWQLLTTVHGWSPVAMVSQT